MPKECSLPEFPTLERCLVIESRFSVRTEVLKSLKSSNLFSELKIADSVQDGLKKINANDFDACIVGSSVSSESANNFIENANFQSKKKDCAFIILTDKEPASHENIQRKVFPHGEIKFPTTKRKFTEEIVKSVVKANNTCVWSELYTEFVLKQNSNDQHENTNTIKQKATVLGSQFKILEEILEGINLGIYTIDDDGKPNSRASWILDHTFEKLFNLKPISEKELAFASVFRTVLEEWFLTCLKGNVDQANSEFKSKLFSYLKINLS